MLEADGAPKTKRRRRGTPRLLLLDAGRELFSAQGYSSTSTREIAERADVSETLLFRYFGSKSGLFREAVVVPFTEVVDSFNGKWQSGFPADADHEEIARQIVGDLYDLFRKNRALVVMLWADDVANDDLADSGVLDEVDKALQVLVDISATEVIRRGGKPSSHHDVATRTTVAMIAGMAVFGSSFYGRRRPARKAIVEELVEATLHGHLYRRS